MAEETEHAESLQLQAYETIRNAILYAHYAPGDKLMVKDLCLELDMGRTPIRESLVRLRQEGLVQTVPQSGTYVSRISLRSVECARYVREQMERSVAVECCAKIGPQQIRGLAQIVERQRKAAEAGDRCAFFDGDNELHQALYDAADRSRVWEWLELISIDLQRYRWLRMQTEELDWNAILDQHLEICDALAERDADEVGYLVSAHLHLLFEESAAVIKTFPDYFINDR